MKIYLPKNRNKRKRFFFFCSIQVLLIAIIIVGVFSCGRKKGVSPFGKPQIKYSKENPLQRPTLDVQLLTKNEYSRPGSKLKKVKGIVVHYTGNPGTSAQANRNYFEGLKDSHLTNASSHFIIGLDGEIIQCVPSSEIAYASNSRNKDTISIECCHPKTDGEFTEATYDSLVSLTAWLCCQFKVQPENIIRHYDITGKDCPKYYVEHGDKWEEFKKEVEQYIKQNS